MSTTEPTDNPTPQPSWTPAPQGAPPAPRKRPSKRLVAVLLAVLVAVAAITTLTVTTVQQHGKAVDARSSLADTRKDLSDTKADLATTEDSLATTETALTSAQGTIADQDVQLAACANVVQVSDLQYEQLIILGDAASDFLDGDYSSNDLDTAGDYADEVNQIIEDNGFEDWDSFYRACAPDHQTL